MPYPLDPDPGHRPRRAVRAASILAILVAAVLAVAAPGAAAATRECFLLTQCTPVVGPWVVIPAADPLPVAAGASVSCPDSDSVQLAVGSDYELSGAGVTPPNVTRFMPGPGIGLITGGNAFFFAISLTATSASFRPHIGCIPQPRARAARAAPAAGAAQSSVVRTREVALHPSRMVNRSHRCRAGERLVRGVAGVLFHRRRPPTARELRDVAVTHTTAGRRVRALVRTGATVGDHERVTLQILAVCER